MGILMMYGLNHLVSRNDRPPDCCAEILVVYSVKLLRTMMSVRGPQTDIVAIDRSLPPESIGMLEFLGNSVGTLKDPRKYARMILIDQEQHCFGATLEWIRKHRACLLDEWRVLTTLTESPGDADSAIRALGLVCPIRE